MEKSQLDNMMLWILNIMFMIHKQILQQLLIAQMEILFKLLL
jgi:hypothetical protein